MQTDTAKYKAFFEALKEEILGGKYSATRKLPSEAQLMRRFGGSRVTMIHALQELRERGLIVRQKGSGSFLAANARNYGRSLGLVIPISRGEIFPPICREVTRLAQQDGYAILLADFMAAPPEHRVAEARRIMEDFVARDVLGVVFHLTDGVPDATRVNGAQGAGRRPDPRGADRQRLRAVPAAQPLRCGGCGRRGRGLPPHAPSA